MNAETNDMDQWNIWNLALFSVMGMGANWVLPTALYQQVPWFSEHLPEELCIATYMNVAAACAACFAFMFFIITERGYHVPHSVSVPLLLMLSFIGSVYVALTYSYSIFGNSYYLYFGHFIGSFVGAFSAIIFNPFMAQFEAQYISAARGGGSMAILLSAVIAFIQSPGKNPRFSPMIFILIFSVLFVFPIAAYQKIVKERIGTRRVNTAEGRSLGSVSSDIDTGTMNPILLNSEVKKEGSLAADLYIKKAYYWKDPWFKFTLPYALSIGWVNFHTWGMLSAVVPFAMNYAAVNISEFLLLALAYEIGAFALVLGDFSTLHCKLPFKVILPIFTAASFMIYFAALNVHDFHDTATGPCLVVCFSVGRFIEAHVLTTCFRTIANELPPGERDEGSRILGLFDQMSTVLGIVTSTVLITLLVNCHDNDD